MCVAGLLQRPAASASGLTVSLFPHSPSSSSRFGSSCNISQGSSHLSDLDHYPGSGPDSEREDEPLEAPSAAPPLQEAAGVPPEPSKALERERLVEGEPEGRAVLEPPAEAEPPREAATRPPGG